jgi:PAS domain S-box-containing protein
VPGRLARIPKGVTARISGLSWMVTLSTLIIFVTASVPDQKRDLLEGLRSKARAVSVSLAEGMAGAAVNEDYSSVVDQCVRELAEDKAIEYVVIAKNDGFSLIVEKSGWRTQNLGAFWRPAARVPDGHIETVPMFGLRAFHFATPFDYSSIEWGWIHVGLSVDAYDRSVRGIYRRTAVLAIVCTALSLIVSVIFARRLVRPLFRLQSMAQRIAEGDWSARADGGRVDEIHRLAASFNRMADFLLQRDQILESIRFAAQRFLSAAAWQTVVLEVLMKIGRAAHTGRVFLLECHPAERHGLVGELLYEWTAPGSAFLASLPDRPAVRWTGRDWGLRAARLRDGGMVAVRAAELAAGPSDPLAAPARSSILVPVEVAGVWFGVLGFDDFADDRDWSEAERDSFRSAAGMLGAAITRQRAQEYVDNIIRSMDESLIVLDPNLRIRHVNPSAQRLLDYSEEELLGHAIRKVLVEGDALGANRAAERIYRTKSGKLIPVLFSAAELRTGRELPEGYVCLAQEVTELKRTQAELVAARDAAQEANRAKSIFLANMSHELRTPLNAIIGYSQMLREDSIGAEQPAVADDLRKIERSGQLLLGIINDILDLSKIEAGRETVRAQAVDVMQVLEDVRHAVAPLARQQENVIEIHCPEAARQAYADLSKFRQSVLNLVNNACKFTEKGRVSIAVERRRDGAGEWTEVHVSDTGIGIAPEHLAKLFQPFSQVDGSSTRKYNGTGLGLAISKKFCQMMGGDITVASEVGRGSRFSIRLPAGERQPMRDDKEVSCV